MGLPKKTVAVALSVIIIVAALSLYYWVSSQPKPLQSVNVTLDYVPNGQELPFFVAADRGFFSKYGLEVSITPSSGSAVALRSLASGKAEFVDADVATFLTMVSQENVTNVKMISAYFQHSPLAILYVKGKGITQPKDLEGRTVGSTSGSAIQTLFPIFAKNTGIDTKKVNIISLTPTACGPSMLAGQFDAMLCYYSRGLVDLAPTAVKQGLQLGSFNYSSYGVDTYGLGLFTRADLIQNKPDLVKSFVRGFWEASQFAAKNPEAGIDSFMKFNPQSDRALMLGEWKWAISVIGNQILTVKDPTSAGWIDQARMDTTAAIIAEGFGIPKLASAQLYTNNFSVQP